MPIVLVVDDSPTDRALIGGLLGREGQEWIVEYAGSGTEALELMETVLPHIVITDMQMPGLDGMGLVAAVHEQFPNIPVVLVTGRGSEELAVRALQGGAASYVSKSELSSRLNEIVKQALQMVESNQNWRRLVNSFRDCEFNLSLENDPELIPLVVGVVQQMADSVKLCDATEQRHLGVALDEALINAMYHGNLALPTAELSRVRSLLREGKKSPLLEERRHDPLYAERRVKVKVKLTPQAMEIVVENDGEGFAPETIPSSGPSALENEGGHGLVLIHTFMDEVAFAKHGRQLKMVKRACVWPQ